MAFKGDLSSIGLSEVFQMISMSQKEGTLIVYDDLSKKVIFLGNAGIELLSTGKRKGLRIGDLLVRAGKISEFRLQQVIDAARVDKKLIGDALVDGGFISREEIDEVVRGQIEEELYDLFLWTEARFEFIEGPPSEELRDPDQQVTRLQMDVNSLLLEALRRLDEWKLINERIQMEGVVAFTDDNARQKAEQEADDNLRKIFRNVDGANTVTDIIDRTGMGKFDVCNALIAQLDGGLIQVLDVTEIASRAAAKFREGEREIGMRLFDAAITQQPDNLELMESFARTLDSEGLSERAAETYLKIGRMTREQGEAEKAGAAFERAFELRPDDMEVKTCLFELNIELGAVEAAASIGEDVVRGAINKENYEVAEKFAVQMLDADSRRLVFRILLARVYHRTGRREELKEQADIIQKNMPVSEDERNRIIRELKEYLPGLIEFKQRRRKPSGKGFLLRVFVALFLILIISAVVLAGVYYMQGRNEYERLQATAMQFLKQKRYDKARATLNEFRESIYKHYLLFDDRLEKDLLKIEDDEREERTRLLNAAEEEVKKAVEQMNKLDEDIRNERVAGNFETALKLCDELEELAKKYEKGEFLKKTDGHRGKINEFLGEAAKLMEQAKLLVDGGDCKRAAQIIGELLLRYRTSPQARNARYPLCVQARPAGVRILLDGAEMGKSGDKPLVLYLKPDDKPVLKFDKKGYLPRTLTVANPSIGEVTTILDEKLTKWTFEVPDSVNPQPYPVGDSFLVISNDEVIALSKANQARVWGEKIDEGAIEVHRWTEGLMLFGTSKKRLYVVDPSKSSGTRITTALAIPERLQTGPAVSGNLVYFFGADKSLYAYDLKSLEQKWKVPFQVNAVQPPIVTGGRVIVCGSDGVVYAVDAAEGGTLYLWKYDSNSGITGEPLVSDGVLYFGTTDGKVHAVRASDGSPVWAKPVAVGAEITGSLAAQGGKIFVPGRNGHLKALNLNGSTAWTFTQTEGGRVGSPTAADGFVYFGSDDKHLYKVDMVTGGLIWKSRTGEMIRTKPYIDGGVVYFGSVKHKLFAIDVD